MTNLTIKSFTDGSLTKTLSDGRIKFMVQERKLIASMDAEGNFNTNHKADGTLPIRCAWIMMKAGAFDMIKSQVVEGANYNAIIGSTFGMSPKSISYVKSRQPYYEGQKPVESTPGVVALVNDAPFYREGKLHDAAANVLDERLAASEAVKTVEDFSDVLSAQA